MIVVEQSSKVSAALQIICRLANSAPKMRESLSIHFCQLWKLYSFIFPFQKALPFKVDNVRFILFKKFQLTFRQPALRLNNM